MKGKRKFGAPFMTRTTQKHIAPTPRHLKTLKVENLGGDVAKRKAKPKVEDDKQFLVSRLRIFLKWRNVPAATWLRAALYYGHLTGQIDMVFKEREENGGAPPETAPHETAVDAAADEWLKQAREMARRKDGLPDGKPSSR